MRTIPEADGSVTPTADLLPKLPTAEGQGGIKGGVAALADGHASNAEFRQSLETIQDFDHAVAELLSRTNPDVVSEASRLRDEAGAAEALARSNRYFGVRAAADGEAERLLRLLD